MNVDGAGVGGLDPFVGEDAEAKTSLNALDGMGDTSVGAHMHWARHVCGLIEFCRYTPNAGAHRPWVVRTSA